MAVTSSADHPCRSGAKHPGNVIGRIAIGVLAVFVIVVGAAPGKYAYTTDGGKTQHGVTGRARWLVRVGLIGVGVLLAYIAILGWGRTKWAQRGFLAILLLAFAAISAQAAVWAWHGVFSRRLTRGDKPGYLEAALSEGPSDALAGIIWSHLPRRVAWLLAALLCSALALYLSWASIRLLAGTGSIKSFFHTPVMTVSDSFEVVALLLFLGLLLLIVLYCLTTRDGEGAGAALVVLGLYAFGLTITYFVGLLDGQIEAARKLLDAVGLG